MLIKIFTLSFDSAYGGFNDLVLRDFLKDLEVISVREHFFIRNEIAYLGVDPTVVSPAATSPIDAVCGH
jgi:hypothetical protein